MAHLGDVFNKHGRFVAKIDTKESGMRFAMTGPPRDSEQEATQDLSFIRAAADGEATRLVGLQAMQLAAKHLRDEAKTMPSGSIEKVCGRLIAMIDTNHSGTRFKWKAPLEMASSKPLKIYRPSVLPPTGVLHGWPSYRPCNWPRSIFEMERKIFGMGRKPLSVEEPRKSREKGTSRV
jgi:hypothetical protein